MPECFITIQGGKVENKTTLEKFWLNHKNGRYEVKTSAKNKRSLDANRYYFGCVLQVVFDALRSAGYDEVQTIEDAHEICKYKFLRKTIVNNHGEFVEKIGSTAKLSKAEFTFYIDQIYRWMLEYFNVEIPPAGSQSATNYE